MTHVHARDLMFYTRPANTDAQIVDEVINKDTYGMWGVIKPHHTVIDIGGHIGSFGVFAAALGANVFSYEAVRANYDLLKRNMMLNGFPFIAYKLAVMGKQEDKRKVFIRESNFGGNNMYGESTKNAPFETVDCITLGQVFKDNNIDECDFLKMDCEGAETEILAAFSGLRRIKYISLEAHGAGRVALLESMLQETHELVGKDDGDMPIMRWRRK